MSATCPTCGHVTFTVQEKQAQQARMMEELRSSMKLMQRAMDGVLRPRPKTPLMMRAEADRLEAAARDLRLRAEQIDKDE